MSGKSLPIIGRPSFAFALGGGSGDEAVPKGGAEAAPVAPAAFR